MVGFVVGGRLAPGTFRGIGGRHARTIQFRRPRYRPIRGILVQREVPPLPRAPKATNGLECAQGGNSWRARGDVLYRAQGWVRDSTMTWIGRGWPLHWLRAPPNPWLARACRGSCAGAQHRSMPEQAALGHLAIRHLPSRTGPEKRVPVGFWPHRGRHVHPSGAHLHRR